MDRQSELSIVRAAYAKQVLAAARVASDARLEAALGAVRREDFVGPGPWPIMRWWGDTRRAASGERLRDYVTTPDADPVYLYTDDLVGLIPERQINNGQPSLHARLMHQAAPAAGEHVRSEEHTSELQSRENLVCRLLLEKKKKKNKSLNTTETNRQNITHN